MFSVTKKITLAVALIVLCFAPPQVFADSDSLAVKSDGYTGIAAPIILDKDEETTPLVLKMVFSLKRENQRRLLKKKPLKACDSNPILGKILSGFHEHIKQAFGEDIKRKGNFIYFFTTEDHYKDKDLIFLLCHWPEK
jgi:hypothetical protein